MVTHPKLSAEQLLLADIWAEFKAAGYDNDREIIEYLAYLLLNAVLPQQPEPIPAAENIAVSSIRYKVDEAKVVNLLNGAIPLFAERGGIAAFFDRYILFYPTKGWRSDTYPIPRHIVDFMLAILHIEPKHRFADFTCGQGGFLVNRYRLSSNHPGETFGVEISPEMMRLAHANALLHGMNRHDTSLALGDAFGVSALANSNQLFDRIAMAPPFAGDVNTEWIKRLWGQVPDRSYRTLFTRLALNCLTPGGQAVVLVPDGLLRNAGASQQLREELINDHTVKAVITLQAGLFLPYATTPISILLFQKGTEDDRVVESSQSTWFLHIATDGYPLNASRNLLAEPPKMFGDLPLAQAAILVKADAPATFQSIPGSGLACIAIVDAPGVLFKVDQNVILFSIRSFQPSGGDREHYLVTQTSVRGKPSTYTMIPIFQGQPDMEKVQVIQTTEAFHAWIKQIFHLPANTDAEDLPEGEYIFGQGKSDQMIAITVDGRLLGFTKTRDELKEAAYTLSDDSYWRQHAEPRQEITGVAQQLQEVRQSQSRIDAYVENLQGQIEFKQLLTEPLPPALLDLGQFPLLTLLSKEQEQIWKNICQRVVPLDQQSSESQYAWPFTLKDLEDQAQGKDVKEGDGTVEAKNENQVAIEQTVHLLESLGLIVQVTPSGSTSSPTYYRRVTSLEKVVWEKQPESE